MMRSKNTYRVLAGAFLAVSSVLPTACHVEEPVGTEEESPVTLSDLKLSFGTKDGSGGSGTYTDTTFRVCLYNTSTFYYTGLSGTYCLPNPAKDGRWLTPCKVVDATGAYDDSVSDPEATIYGLQARNGTYYMAITSPAVAMQSPRKDIYGFYYDRERPFGEKPLCISDSIRAVISGLSTDGSWLYVVDSAIRLKERRSRLKLSISCGDDVESAIVKEIRLANVLSKGYYLPSSMEFDYESSYLEDSVIVAEYNPALTLYKEENPGAGHRKTDTCSIRPCVLSMDYSRTDQHKNPVHPLPEIVVALGEDGGMVVRIPIAYDMIPENVYSCHITINSCYVRLTMSVLDWDGPHDVSGSSESYSQRPLTVTVDLWDNGTSGTSGDTEIHDSEW